MPPFAWRVPAGSSPWYAPGTLVHIYALIDPFTGHIRYIGKTIRPEQRLANHCNEHSNTHRSHWIQSVIRRGRRPKLVVMDSFPSCIGWQAVERAWIAWALEKGEPLTNGTSGGDGVPDLSPESRARIVATWKGRKHRPESLAKIGAASRKRRHTPEWRAYMSRVLAGRQFSPEHRALLSKRLRKLTDEQVRDARRRLAAGDTCSAIARDYGVDKGTLSNLKRGLFYGDVQ
jgi:hypothetical protein